MVPTDVQFKEKEETGNRVHRHRHHPQRGGVMDGAGGASPLSRLRCAFGVTVRLGVYYYVIVGNEINF